MKENKNVTSQTEDTSSIPTKKLSLGAVSDESGSYPQLVHDKTVIDTTTAVVLESDTKRGTAMRGTVTIYWDETITSVTITGPSVDMGENSATMIFMAGEDIMQEGSAFTVQCVLKDGSNPSPTPPSGWVGPTKTGVWTLDPYVRLKRKSYTVTQTT